MLEPDEPKVAAREAAQPPWDDLREARILKSVLAARVEQPTREPSLEQPPVCERRARVGGVWAWSAFTLALALLVALVLMLLRTHELDDRARADESRIEPRVEGGSSEATLAPGGVLEFGEGSRAILTMGAQVELVEDAPALQVNQHFGRVRYEVAKRAGQTFEVHVDDVRVRVHGTVFEVAVDEHEVEVLVLEGEVEVADGERSIVLRAGEQARVRRASSARSGRRVPPSLEGAEERMVSVEPRGAEVGAARARGEAAKPRAEANEDDEQRPSAAERMRRADLARSEGRLGDAAYELRRLVDQHASSPYLGSALLTLARVEAKRGRHAAAAEAYASHAERFPDDPLAEDALAGVAEEWALAGETERSQAAAEAYLDHFPSGLHGTRMRALAGR